MKKSISGLFLLILSGCAALAPVQIATNEALVKGHATYGRGSVKFTDETGKTETRVVVPAGKQALTVIAESTSYVSDQYPGDPRFRCVTCSKQKLNFDAKGGKVYRIWLDESLAPTYNLMVLEEIEPGEIEARQIPSESDEIKKWDSCGFAFSCSREP